MLQESDVPRIRNLPPLAFKLLTDSCINSILSHFSQLETVDDLLPYINSFLRGQEQALFAEIQTLREKFNRMRVGLDPDGL